MNDIGRVCVKIAGRDAGLQCVIVDVLENSMVLIDGQTRRRKCNLKHLEPSAQVIKIKKGAGSDVVVKELKKLGIDVAEVKSRKAAEKPKREKKKSISESVEEKDLKSILKK